jgi:titin
VPGGLTATPASTDQINLSWHDNNGVNATGYEVDRSPDGAIWAPLSTTLSGATSFTDGPGLAEGTSYEYKVRAVNTNTTPVTYSQFATVSTFTLLQAPASLSAVAASASQIDLQWTNNTTLASQVVIQRSPDGVNGWTTVGAVGAALNTFTDTNGLAEGSPYFYRVQAANLNAASAMVDGASPATTWLATPALSAAAISSAQINLSWVNNSAHATGFEVQHSPDGLTNWTTLATPLVGVTSYPDTPLTPGVTYHYRMRALGTGVDSSYTAPVAGYVPPFWVYFPVMAQ